VIFLVIPLVLFSFRFNLDSILIFGIACMSIVTDELLTKVGLKMGLKENNQVFNFLIKKIGERFTHALLTVGGVALLLGVLFFFNDNLLLLFFAVGFTVPIVINAFTLLRKVLIVEIAHKTSVEKPPET